jgi:hypothetical protein
MTNMDANLEDDENITPPLAEDNTTPFSSPADPVSDMTDSTDREADATLDPTHQTTDNASDIDSHESYDEGLSGAAESMEPDAGSAVESYDPENDQRKQAA